MFEGLPAAQVASSREDEDVACFEIVPHKLVYGGASLGHRDGRAVLVPLALPGERVEVELRRQSKGVIHTRLLRVLAPSPERVAPPCPYFGRCGGCHYQHLSPARQLEVKREILRETLRRIGRIGWPGEIAVHAAEPWHYRNQIQLKVSRGQDGQTALGFFAAKSRRLVSLDACLISSPRLNALLGELARPEWVARLAGCCEVALFADASDQDVMLTLRCSAGAEGIEELAQDCLSRLPGVATVAIEPETKSRAAPGVRSAGQGEAEVRAAEPKVLGKPRLTYRVGAFQYEISPGSFFQASRFLLPEFVEAVTAGEQIAGTALDLYAGVGLFTLPLARRFSQVVGVEANRRAAADLAHNARAHGLANVRAVAAPAAEFLRRYAQTPELVVLDPPRAGAEIRTLRRLAELGPGRIHYASCDAPTLARDLAYLLRHNYRLDSVELFDFYPQTFHIESLAKLSRAAAREEA